MTYSGSGYGSGIPRSLNKKIISQFVDLVAIKYFVALTSQLHRACARLSRVASATPGSLGGGTSAAEYLA